MCFCYTAEYFSVWRRMGIKMWEKEKNHSINCLVSNVKIFVFTVVKNENKRYEQIVGSEICGRKNSMNFSFSHQCLLSYHKVFVTICRIRTYMNEWVIQFFLISYILNNLQWMKCNWTDCFTLWILKCVRYQCSKDNI